MDPTRLKVLDQKAISSVCMPTGKEWLVPSARVEMSAIEFKDFSFRYLNTDEPVLRHINLTIEEGQIVGILGPAGAGKSTFVQTLNALVPKVNIGYQDGDLIVRGMNTRDHEVSEMAQSVSLVLQNPDVQIFSLTVKDDVAFGPANLGLPREEIWQRVNTAMQETQMTEFADRNPNDLSGGEQQSLALAGAMAMRPRTLALDEPVAMLDPVGKEQVFDLVKRVSRGDRHMTTIITESGADVEAIADSVDRVIGLQNGEIVLDGTPDEVLQSSKLEEMGVGRPQVTELFLELHARGLDFPRIPITLEQAAGLIRERLVAMGCRAVQLPPGFAAPGNGAAFGGPVIQVKNLEHTYPPDVRALRGVSFEVREREMVGIIGQNGSGKTTLARHLVGLLKPTNRQAELRVLGKDLKKLHLEQIIQMINYVFQNPDDQLFAETVHDEIAFSGQMLGWKKDKIEDAVKEALAAFDLQEHENDYIMGLAENLKTYLAITCVLPLHPRILLIDEPTTGLDTRGEVLMMKNLRRLRDRGETIVIITHNMKTVAGHCDRAIVMRQGEIILDGPTRDVYARADVLEQADIRPPQITQLGQRLADLSFPPNVLTVSEMADLLQFNLQRP
jgi:energy-coupling factor transport system ATP-binding protein